MLNKKNKYNMAFESGKLSYSNKKVDLYNSGVNQVLSLAALKGHNIFHFRAKDIFEKNKKAYAKMSVLKFSGKLKLLGKAIKNPLNAHEYLKKQKKIEMPLSEINAFFLRADDIRYDTPNLELLQKQEHRSVFLENIKDTLDTSDKYELVKRCPDVPSPAVYKADTLEQALEGINKLPDNEGKFILKDRFGYGCGKQVHLLYFDDKKLEEKLNKYIKQYKKTIVQEFCPEVRNGDLVVTFFDGKLVAPMRRIAKKGEWKTNASLGAKECACDLSPRLEEIAKYVVKAFPGCRFSSVDMLDSGKVLEINAFPGASGLYKNYGIVVGEQIINKIETEIMGKINNIKYSPVKYENIAKNPIKDNVLQGDAIIHLV